MQEKNYRLIEMNAFIKFAFGFTSIVLTAIFSGCTNFSQSSELKNSNIIISPTVKVQTEPQLNDDDKTQIVVEILKQENLRDAKERKKNAQNIIYVEGQLPAKQIPQIEGIEVKFIPSFMEAKKESEIVYYEFRDFETKNSKIVIPVIWNKRDSSSGHSAIIEYECEKISGKWKVEGKVTGASVSESH